MYQWSQKECTLLWIKQVIQGFSDQNLYKRKQEYPKSENVKCFLSKSTSLLAGSSTDLTLLSSNSEYLKKQQNLLTGQYSVIIHP